MTTSRDIVIAIALGALAAWAGTCLAECDAHAAEPVEASVAVGVSRLQPRLTADAARDWAQAITRAARPHRLDPLLVAAIAMRESSFDLDVAEGRRRGARGEVGVMQVIPGGAALRFAPLRCSQSEPWCSLATGCGFLAYHRDHGCPGSTWRWVAAYGRRRCPSEAEAHTDRATIRAHRLYRSAGGRGWR